MTSIVDRIERESGVPGLASILAERLAPSDLQSLLLEVQRRRAGRRRPSDVLAGYEADRFVRPSPVSPALLLVWEQTLLSQLPPEFEPLALSPVCPLGTSSAVAAVDQNWAVATVRNTEVVSDSTNVLALECAVRRRALARARARTAEAVHLAASHRLLRGQRYDSPDLSSHFGAFAMCSAGRDLGSWRFELEAISRHARIYLGALRLFLGPEVRLQLSVTDLAGGERDSVLQERLLSPIQADLPAVECTIDRERTRGRGYYRDLCFHIHATGPSGRRLELVDGGSVDWTERLLSNAKERLIISGIGSERVCTELPRRP